VEVETEADSNDITECPHDDNPTTGMFGFLILYSLHLFAIFALFLLLFFISGSHTFIPPGPKPPSAEAAQ